MEYPYCNGTMLPIDLKRLKLLPLIFLFNNILNARSLYIKKKSNYFLISTNS